MDELELMEDEHAPEWFGEPEQDEPYGERFGKPIGKDKGNDKSER